MERGRRTLPDLSSICNLKKKIQVQSQLVSPLFCEVPVEDIVTPFGDKEPEVQSGYMHARRGIQPGHSKDWS